ncbi:MAG: recombinase family protein, partial [Pseudonocardia sp.]|nr:recombinase family protein [Pseudonocardia sp.]
PGVSQPPRGGPPPCRSQDWEVVGVYRDDGISASRFANGKARDEWQRVVEQVIAGGCDILILWEVSRATRDRTVYANLIGACVAAGVLIDVGGRLHDPSDPDEGFLLDLQAGLAVRESGVTSKRIRANVEARAQAGTPHGKLPYGYRRIYEQRPAGRVLLEQVPDPELDL